VHCPLLRQWLTYAVVVSVSDSALVTTAQDELVNMISNLYDEQGIPIGVVMHLCYSAGKDLASADTDQVCVPQPKACRMSLFGRYLSSSYQRVDAVLMASVFCVLCSAFQLGFRS